MGISAWTVGKGQHWVKEGRRGRAKFIAGISNTIIHAPSSLSSMYPHILTVHQYIDLAQIFHM